MITSILLLAVVFLAGLLTTNLPSKFFAMFISIISVNSSSSSSSSPPPDVVITTKTSAAATATATSNVVKKSSVSCSNKEELKRVFATFDKNGDGSITKQELKESLKNMGMVVNEKDVEDLIWTVDTNEDGLIDLDEFCESFASLVSSSNEKKGSIPEEEEEEEEGGDRELKEAFDVFDEDKNGVITVEELGLVLSNMGFGLGNRLEECSKMIKKVDMDGDGNVNFQEFKKMMKHGHEIGFLPHPLA